MVTILKETSIFSFINRPCKEDFYWWNNEIRPLCGGPWPDMLVALTRVFPQEPLHLQRRFLSVWSHWDTSSGQQKKRGHYSQCPVRSALAVAGTQYLTTLSYRSRSLSDYTRGQFWTTLGIRKHCNLPDDYLWLGSTRWNYDLNQIAIIISAWLDWIGEVIP